MSIAFVSGIAAQSVDANNVTSGVIDTSGANLIVIAVGSAGTPFTLSDSKSNSWTGLTAQSVGFGSSQLYYCVGTTVGSGHTFSIASSGKAPALCIAAFSGVLASSPFDVQNGNAVNGVSSPLSSGSVTPSQNYELIVTGAQIGGQSSNASIDSSFIIPAQAIGAPGQAWGCAMAYLIQTGAAATNPTWTGGSGYSFGGVTIATFKSAALGSLKRNPPLDGLSASGGFFGNPLY